MPTCPSCGKPFSGFSIASQKVTECADCRKAKMLQAEVTSTMPAAGTQRPVPGTFLRSSPPVTRALIGLNVLVYVAMGWSGVSWTEPSVLHAIRWGADFGPLTFSGEWWRALTSMFVHFGIIHIALNMWCLWSLGSSLEPLMGPWGFGLTYLFSGLAGSVASLAWNPWRPSAGASGAIFGVAGAFVTFLLLKKLPIEKTLVRRNLRSMGFFILYNLLYGAANSHIDNSAHIGGLVAGLILGALVPASMRFATPTIDARVSGLPIDAVTTGDSRQRRLVWIAAGCSLALVLGLYFVRARNLSVAQYGKAVSLATSGQMDRAIVEMKETLTLDPGNVLAQLLLGDWLLEQNDPVAAIPYLEQARQLEPDAGQIHHNLALAYLGAGRPKDAAVELSEIAGKGQENPWQASYILGVAAEQAGNYRLAAQNLNSALQAKADFSEAQDELAHVSAAQNSPSSSSDPRPRQIPYPKLLMKSPAWPYYP